MVFLLLVLGISEFEGLENMWMVLSVSANCTDLWLEINMCNFTWLQYSYPSPSRHNFNAGLRVVWAGFDSRCSMGFRAWLPMDGVGSRRVDFGMIRGFLKSQHRLGIHSD